LADLTRSSSLARARNPRAGASLVVGLLAVAAIPAGVGVARYTRVTLLQSAVSIGVAAVLGAYALLLARRGRERVQLTLGRSGGGTAARIGRMLGILALWGAGAAGLAVGFYGLLTIFAS
jgi:hypothetical protein